MDLRQLEAFCQVARCESFTRAARELHLSQPAVSRQIDNLEQAVGARLFERSNHALRLTEAGERLLGYAQTALQTLSEARRAVQDAQDPTARRLVIAASTTVGNYLLPPILARFAARFPDLEISLRVDCSGNVEKMLGAQAVDLALLDGPEKSGGLFAEPVFHDSLVLIVPPSSPLARLSEIPPGALGEQTLLVREPGSASRERVLGYLRQQGLRPARVLEIAGVEAIKHLVNKGLGIAYIPRSSVTPCELQGRMYALGRGPAVRLPRVFNLVAPGAARHRAPVTLFSAYLHRQALRRPDVP